MELVTRVCGGAFFTVGSDLPGVTPGQTATITVVPHNFAVPNAWKVIVKTE